MTLPFEAGGFANGFSAMKVFIGSCGSLLDCAVHSGLVSVQLVAACFFSAFSLFISIGRKSSVRAIARADSL